MNGTEIGVLKKPHEVRLCSFLESKDRMALETQIRLSKQENKITKPRKENPNPHKIQGKSYKKI